MKKDNVMKKRTGRVIKLNNSLFFKQLLLSVLPVILTSVVVGVIGIVCIVYSARMELNMHLSDVMNTAQLLVDDTSQDELTQTLCSLKEKTDMHFIVERYGDFISTYQDVDSQKVQELVESLVQDKKKGTRNYVMERSFDGVAYYCGYNQTTDYKIISMYPEKYILKNLNYICKNLIKASALLILLSTISSIFFSRKLVKCILFNVDGIKEMAKGNLSFKVNQKVLKRKDELGAMGNEMNNLKENLVQIVSAIQEKSIILKDASNELKQTSLQSNKISDEFSVVIGEIAQSTSAQAGETKSVYTNMTEIGNAIEKILTSISELSSCSGEISKADDSATYLLENLFTTNVQTMKSIEQISTQISVTNDSAKEIEEVLSIISDIADETNLLALNASIEAARAGEEGKGFSVVASEIKKLAEETSKSANRISEIIDTLLRNSAEMVNMMVNVNEMISTQTERLDETKAEFAEVSVNIQDSVTKIDNMQSAVDELNRQKEATMHNVNKLEALSQSNAASTEEANASCEEMNAGINSIAEASSNLNEISTDLMDQIAFFQLNE